MPEALAKLKEQLTLIGGLIYANALMGWDQESQMPEGGAAPRARAMASVSHVAHEMSTSAEYARLLEAAEAEADRLGLDPDSDDARLLWWARRDFARDTRLPAPFVAELTEKTSVANQVWQAARRDDDYERFAPHLAEIIRLQRQLAEYMGYEAHPYDALLDLYEPDLTTAEVRRIFDDLRERTVPLVRAIAERQDAVDSSPLYQFFPEERQWALARETTARFGYDYNRGRMDRSAHPFCMGLATDDVRITLRAEENFFNACFFAALHECGHALYEQGLPTHFQWTPLGAAASSAFHESQSRLWENIVGRSRAFWRGYYARVQAVFPQQLGNVEMEAFYRAINRAEPSPIRVEADEVTYNLHVMLRFDLEVAMMEETITVRDLPKRWNEKMEQYLGIVPESDAAGVLQDTHWAIGLYGYFPTYTLGNVLSVQLYEAATETHPDIPQQIEQGNTAPLLGWMREHIHAQGRKYLPQELLLRAAHRPLDAGPYVRYLEEKYSDIYGLAS
ncbi:MAG: carboxypeptidase M32 [Ardenticatenaceae bacterium]